MPVADTDRVRSSYGELELAGWRREMGALYAAVRAEAEPERGHALWRAGRDSSSGPTRRARCCPTTRCAPPVCPTGPTTAGLRFELPLLEPVAPARALAAERGRRRHDAAAGRPHRAAGAGRGDASTCGGCGSTRGGLFLPLRDGTAGDTSYGGGRYLLDTAKGADLGGSAGRLVVDLNFLYHPSCRYNIAWQCPLAPAGNTIGGTSSGRRAALSGHAGRID